MANVRTHTQMVLVAGALLVAGTAAARGQDAPTDPRWLPFLGCWEADAAAAPRVCVVPAGGSAVDLVTMVNGQVAAREHIVTSGERQPSSQDTCTGWESAAWSAAGQRVYLRAEQECPVGAARRASGLIAMSGNGQWLYVQGVAVGDQTGIRVLRYRETANDTTVLQAGVSAVSQARAAAGAPLGIDDVVEASRHVDATVLEAWLAERGEPFAIDAKRLFALADAGVPPRVIDLMVALSYPRVFAINPTSRQAERRPGQPDSAGYRSGSPVGTMEPSCYVGHPWFSYDAYACSGYGYGAYSPFGYDGYGYYPGGYPIIIVVRDSGGGGGTPRAHGRVVNGRGYSEGGSTGGSQATPRPAPEPSWPSGSTTSSGGRSGSSSGTSSGSSTSSGEQRTAHPRPPK